SASRHRRQFRPHRPRQHRGNTSHGREDAVFRSRICRAVGAGTQRHRQAGRFAENGCRMTDDRRRTTDNRRRTTYDGRHISNPPRIHRKICPPSSVVCRLVIATHNPGKLAEMRELLAPYGIDAISAGELDLPEPDEDGMSFRDNARIKAEAAAIATDLPAFADDSGLVVDALDGAPGIHSARWAGPEKNFRRAMETIEVKLYEH